MLEPLIQRWSMMAPREKRLVAGGAVLLVMAAVYLLLIEPAWQGRARLDKELPVLRAQLARVDQLADEVVRLSASPGGVESAQTARERLEQSVDAAGLRASLAQLQQTGSLFDVRFRSVPFAQWLVWLEATARDARLRVVDVNVTRDATPGMVTARVSLEFSPRPGR
jgi:general secretion pathway protein M